MYVTVGTAGAPFDDGELMPNQWTEVFDKSHYGVGRATVMNATVMYWEFVVVGGNIRDEVWLTRNRDQK